MSAIKDAVKDYILREFLNGEKPENLKDDTRLIDSGILDSYNILRLVQFIENTYHVTVQGHEVDIDNLDTLSRIETFVERKMK